MCNIELNLNIIRRKTKFQIWTNFQELLLEQAELFYHVKSIAPTGTITQEDIRDITQTLQEDSRWGQQLVIKCLSSFLREIKIISKLEWEFQDFFIILQGHTFWVGYSSSNVFYISNDFQNFPQLRMLALLATLSSFPSWTYYAL